jgi:hypothetical protein
LFVVAAPDTGLFFLALARRVVQLQQCLSALLQSLSGMHEALTGLKAGFDVQPTRQIVGFLL